MVNQFNRRTLGDVSSTVSLSKSVVILSKWFFIELIPKLRFFGILKLSTAFVSIVGTPYASPSDLQFFIKFIVPIITLLLLWPSHTLPRLEGWGIRWLMGVLGINYALIDYKQGWLTTLAYGSEMPIKIDTIVFGSFCLCVATYCILRGMALSKREGAYRNFFHFMIQGLANLLIPPTVRMPVYPAGYFERKIAQNQLAQNDEKKTASQYMNDLQSELQRSRQFLSTSSWITLREEIFKERKGECTDCGAFHKTLKDGKLVECYPRHIIYPGLYPELGLLKENVIILCKDCGKNRIKKPLSQEEEEEIAHNMRQQYLKV